jgi:hypothetical protein
MAERLAFEDSAARKSKVSERQVRVAMGSGFTRGN